ncbi:MAG: hypothetical protein ACRDTC_21815 [Pseudonocardiaceae bacterium]
MRKRVESEEQKLTVVEDVMVAEHRDVQAWPIDKETDEIKWKLGTEWMQQP